jgi:acylphosphatase
MVVARKFIVSGMVQGVGFRFFTQRCAAKHQVVGYVMNLSDGRVEAWAEGNFESVEGFKKDMAAGPSYSRVEEVEEISVEPVGYPQFRIEI